MTLKIVARDSALRKLGEIDDFESLSLMLHFNRTSGWELVLDAASPAVALLTITGGIIVERDGRAILTGPVVDMTSRTNGGRSTVTVTGVDDTVWLERRLALPVPSGPPYTSSAYDLRNGTAEAVMLAYVNANLGSTATADRRLARFSTTGDGTRGTSVKGHARFGTLTSLLQELALAGGDLGFRITQSFETLVFEVYQPADKTETAIFSVPFGNLLGYEYKQTAPEANYVYVGGSGEGTARVIVEGGRSASIATHMRFETFQDRRDTDDTATLEQHRDETLDEMQAKTALAISPIDTDAVTYGRDYNLGDKVTATIDGVAIKDVVREVYLTLTPERGEVINPVLGTPGASSPGVPSLFDAVRRQARRLSNLERR